MWMDGNCFEHRSTPPWRCAVHHFKNELSSPLKGRRDFCHMLCCCSCWWGSASTPSSKDGLWAVLLHCKSPGAVNTMCELLAACWQMDAECYWEIKNYQDKTAVVWCRPQLNQVPAQWSLSEFWLLLSSGNETYLGLSRQWVHYQA